MSTQINRIIKKVEQRESSYEAWLDIQHIKNNHYRAILKTMMFLNKPATGKVISYSCELSYHQIQRRLKEMETEGLVKVSGRSEEKFKPMLWAIVEPKLN